MEEKFRVAMFGQKRLSREGGIEIVVKELCTRMVQAGCQVTCYNRAGHHVSGAEYDDKTEYEGICQKSVPTIEKKGLRKVLDDFKPDVCHLNNFNYQLTPSIILEIVKWCKETGRDCKIIFTAHDYQLVCPNHMLNNPNTHQNCEKCLGGHFVNCMKGKCIHGSTAKSAIGMMEAEFWKWKGTYKYIDTMICCSEFMKSKMDSNPLFATKTVTMHYEHNITYHGSRYRQPFRNRN